MKRVISLFQVGPFRRAAWRVGLSVLVLSTPLLLSEFYLNLVIVMLIRGLLALSFNFLYGFAGRLSFGHAAFFGTGAYALGILLTRTEASFPMAVVAAIVSSSLAAALIGYFCVRFLTYYFSLLTLAFGQLFFLVVDKWYGLTGDDDGLQGILAPYPISEVTWKYYYVLVITSVAAVLLWRILKSPYGSTLRAIRDNRERAEFIGVNVKRYEWGAFVISGTFAGLAGALFAHSNQSISPYLLSWTRSAEPVIMTILGGPYIFWSPLLGAVVFTALESVIPDLLFEVWPMALGGLLVMMVLFFPEGIWGIASTKPASSGNDQ